MRMAAARRRHGCVRASAHNIPARSDALLWSGGTLYSHTRRRIPARVHVESRHRGCMAERTWAAEARLKDAGACLCRCSCPCWVRRVGGKHCTGVHGSREVHSLVWGPGLHRWQCQACMMGWQLRQRRFSIHLRLQ